MAGDASGLSGPPGVLLTREVRWFHDGPLPPEVMDWFTASDDGEVEYRTDRYDIGAARRGVGVKLRNRDAVDAKFPVHRTGPVTLAPGIEGRVEDWVKLTFPVAPSSTAMAALVVDKEIVTRRHLVRADPTAGCEVELVAIAAGPRRSWTLALETFGSAGLLEQSLRTGIDGLRAAAPFPQALRLVGDRSSGYPAWIDQMVQIG